MSNRLARRNSIQGWLQRRDHHLQPLEALGQGQGPELQQPFGQPFSNVWVGDQHDLAAVGLHSLAAFLGVERVVDQHNGSQVVAPRQLRHQSMHPRLRAKARRTGRHVGNPKDTEAF